jgi:hypothetical protein
MKGKWMLESNTTICMAARNMLFFTYQFKENEKPLVLESNTPPLICYESHL